LGGTAVLHAVAVSLLPPVQFHKYTVAAAQWLDGSLPPERWADFSPLYLLLHAGLRALVPWPGPVMVALHVAFTAAAAGLCVHLLARHVSLGAALGATALLALDADLLAYTRLLEPEALVVLLVAAVLALADGASPRSRVAAGVVAGLGLAVRPTLAPLALLVPLWWWWRDRSWPRVAWAYLLGPAAAWLALAAWSQAATGSPTTAVMNPGTVFYEGNNPSSPGLSAVYPPFLLAVDDDVARGPDHAHQLYREVARRSTGTPLTVAEVNAFWRDKALAFVADHPVHAATRCARKVLYALGSHTSHDIPSAYLLRDALAAPWSPFLGGAWLSALAVAGLLLVRRRHQALAVAVVVVQVGAVAVFYGSARQRLTAVPGMVFLAAVALEHLRRDWPRSARVLLGVAVGALLLSWPVGAVENEKALYLRGSAAAGMSRAAAAASGQGDHGQAGTLVASARALAPWLGDAVRPAATPWGAAEAVALSPPPTDAASAVDRARLLLDAGRLEEVGPTLAPWTGATDLNRRNRQSSCVGHDAAVALWLRGDSAGAQSVLRGCLQVHPGDPFVLALLALAPNGDAHLATLLRYHAALDAHWLQGQAALRVGRGDAALPHLAWVAERWPGLRSLPLDMAAAHALAGRAQEAVRRVQEALVAGHAAAVHQEVILGAFSLWHAGRGDDPAASLWLARIQRLYGLRQPGRHTLQGLLDRGFPPGDLPADLADLVPESVRPRPPGVGAAPAPADAAANSR
jgi:hypothetical protein